MGTRRSWSGIMSVARTTMNSSLPPGEPEAREGVAGDAAEDQVGDHHRDRQDGAVEEQHRQRRVERVPGVSPGVERDRVGDEAECR